ncbi:MULTISPECIES: YfdX family protein [unclassified Lebetimonas]|uniref:YfdX family protein n=1 Tax=unclassified Lebetimonas TaxID=2648158 RepID=UPI0004676D79|nr:MULTISPECIES: YfdX family protein [unclassified Lebetimonas]
MKRILTSVVLASILVSSSLAADAKTAQVSKKAVIKAEKKAQNTELANEAVKAIQYTQDTLIYISGKNTKKAKDSIKKAIGELSDLLNRPNTPYLLPVDVQINAYQYQGDVKDVKKLASEAKILVAENKLPQAREVLNSLRSEIVIKTINLPIATYPAALNLALKYINEGKAKEAKDVLSMALSTLVETDTIIPIPLIKAQALVKNASESVKKDKNQALKYLDEAKKQLSLAEILGYTSTSDTTYKMLKEQITQLEKEIKNGNKTENIFKKLLQKIEEFKEKAVKTFHK